MSFTLKEVQVRTTFALVIGLIVGFIYGWFVFVRIPVIFGG